MLKFSQQNKYLHCSSEVDPFTGVSGYICIKTQPRSSIKKQQQQNF